jgi:hypothetical protein
VCVGASVVLHLHPERRDGDSVIGKEEYSFVSLDAAPIKMLLETFSTILHLANESMSLRPEESQPARCARDRGRREGRRGELQAQIAAGPAEERRPGTRMEIRRRRPEEIGEGTRR